MTVDLSKLDLGDIVVMRSGAIIKPTQIFILSYGNAPIIIYDEFGKSLYYKINGCSLEKCHPAAAPIYEIIKESEYHRKNNSIYKGYISRTDIVEVIKNPKGLALADIIRESLK